MSIQTIGIIGAGQMGSGIAQVCAQNGYTTFLTDAAQEFVDRGAARILGAWDTMESKGKISHDDVLLYRSRLRPTMNLQDYVACDVVIEAIIENKAEKVKIFRALDDLLRPEALLLSNTSSISLTEIAAVTKRADRVAGLHFFNPAPVMKLVEIVRALETSDATVETLKEFAASLGKTAVIAKDTAGFIVNFLLIPYLLAAIRMYENGTASMEDIDTAMKLGTGYPMGPFTLADYVGLDTTLFAAEVIYADNPDPAYAPPPLLKRMVAAGRLGKKSGRGFYTYE